MPGLLDVDFHAELFDGAAGCPSSLGAIISPSDPQLPAHFRLDTLLDVDTRRYASSADEHGTAQARGSTRPH